ncbi:hypothetical protein [Aliivibrio wodanis]|uniref:hypothetical protein n=1 Tax=Aliivibrio wodanis TaxID=80852 RepID=UPI00406CAC80
MRGEETINRVNEDIYRLEQDEKLHSTTDQDLFSYRAELISKKHIFTRNYKVEFGDFPGEDSEKLISDDIKWIQNLPYFNWVIDADSFIFIIDVSHAPSNEYRAKLTAAYRAAWQRLKDYHFSGTTQMHSKPVTIVFTKCDLLFGEFDFSENATVFETDVEDKMQSIVKQYDELINYFKNESKKCNVVYSSSYVRDIDKGIKLGAKGILESVLP